MMDMNLDQTRASRSELLGRTSELANQFLDGVGDRPVSRTVDFDKLLAEMEENGLPFDGSNSIQIVEQLSEFADSAIVATAGLRYFGFVVGGSLPVAMAADWLTAAWDQNAAFYAHSPLAAAAEQIAGNWLIELFGLSKGASVGFVTGGTMANFTALAAARHALLAKLGWNVEQQGLFGAPAITVVTSDESHISVFASLQMLGLGSERVVRIPTDDQGRMRSDQLRSILAGISTPVLVCAQAGNVNTGSFDPISEIAACIRERPSWLQVDGAFGLWEAASPTHRSMTQGIELAYSGSVAHHN